MRILIVEDDQEIGRAMQTSLHRQKFAVDWVQTAQEAIQFALLECFDLLVLDLGLPDDDGHKVIKRLREEGQTLSILVVSARDGIDERVRALDEGADDYVIKPLAMSELHARVRAMLRRRMNVAHSSITLGKLTLDMNGKRSFVNKIAIDLSGREWSVLEYLIANTGRIVSKEQLIQAIANWGKELSPNAIEAYVHRIRSKIEGSQVNIRTIRGLGYMLEEPVSA